MREELLSQRRHCTDKHDPLYPYEAYKVDFEFYRLLFLAISPWGKGIQSESIATRLFRVRNIQILSISLPPLSREAKNCFFVG